jgi:arabinofuranan 3-O-arabinosyltransferase
MTTLADDRAVARPVRPQPAPRRQLRAEATDRRNRRRLTVVLVVLSFGSTLSNAPGSYIADSRFEHYWASVQYLSRHQWLWDSFRGLGRAAPYFAPAVAGVLAAFAAVGLNAATSERLLHALYLLTAGLGMVSVLRLFRPRIGLEHLLAALVYMFSPYTSQFLLPSGLFLHYAIAPWLLVAFARGLRAERAHSWRWPAGFALLVLLVGSLNIPSLIYAGVPLVPFIAFVVLVERSARWRDVARFVARAGLLIAVGSIATAIQLKGNAPVLAENLSTTELPATVSRHSSWAESWRGLGFWLSYFRTTNGAARPEALPFFANAGIVAATFAVPCIALSTLWWSRWRPRLLFAVMTLVSLALMVGLYPVRNPPPVGSLLDGAYTHILFLRGLRSGYKAGAGFALGLSALFGVGVADAVRLMRRSALESVPGPSRIACRVLPVVAVLVVGVASFPFWTGSLYSAGDRVDALPGYWTQAIDAVNALPGDGRVLILPGAERNRYRWGYLGDDMFDAFLSHPHLLRQSFSQGMPETGSLLAALDEHTANDRYTPGSFAPLARVLGVQWVLIRNDLDWQKMEAPRPSALDALRLDPSVHLVASYGDPGQNTTASDDTTAGVLGENKLPPVQLFEVADANAPVQVVAASAGAPALVSGDGDGLVPLAASGDLAPGGFRFTASTSTDELDRLLEEGAPLVVTDTNRRRATQVTSSHNFTSYLLPAGQVLDRPALDLYSVAGSQTVATYGAASSITASGFGSALARYENWFRPANAFDGDPLTAWRTAGAGDPVGQWVRVDLSAPATLGELHLTASPVNASRRISKVDVQLSDGTTVSAPIARIGESVVSFPARSVRWFTVRITGTEGGGDAAVGFSEITAPGIDLAEVAQAPDDVFRAADANPALAAALARADVTYSFERLERLGEQDEELDLRRRFRTEGSRPFTLSGTLRTGDSTPDTVVDAILGGPVGASGSVRSGDVASSRGGLAVDGQLDTAWTAPAGAGATLNTRFASQVINHVDIIGAVGSATSSRATYSGITRVAVSVGDNDAVPCSLTRAAPDQPPACHLDLDPVVANHISIRVDAVTVVEGRFGGLPMGIAEVSASGPTGAVPTAAPPTTLTTSCVPIGTIDGETATVRVSGSVEGLLAGDPTSFEGCGSASLATGWHELTSAPGVAGLIAHFDLRSGSSRPPVVTPAATVQTLRQDPAGATLLVTAPDGGRVVLGQSYAPGWVATVAGHTVAATPLDTMDSWTVPPGTTQLTISYRPQRLYELGLAGMAATAALCLVLLLRRERAPRPALAGADGDALWLDRGATGAAPHDVALTLAAAVVGFLFANLEGAVLGAGAVVAARLAGLRLIGKAATLALVLTALTTLIIDLPQVPAGAASFVANREIAGILGQLTAVLVASYVVLALVAERAAAPRSAFAPTPVPWRQRLGQGWRRRLAPTIAAGVAASLVAATVGERSNAVFVTALAFVAVMGAGAMVLVEGRIAARPIVTTPPERAPSNHVLHGSVWLMAGFVVQAVTGVAFWIVAARVNATLDVGRATAVFASLQFVNYATAMGLPEMLTRFTSTEREDADALLSWAIVATTITSALGTIVYVALAVRGSGSTLSPVASISGALVFFIVSVGAAIALLVDARLMAARRWRWVFGRLVAVGAVRIPLLLVPAPFDPALWLFLMIAAPIAISGAVGLWVLRRDERWRLRLRPAPRSTRPSLQYALVSYVSHLALSAPQFALPVIVLVNVDPATNANFFVAWSIAAVAFILPVTIGRVLLAEGSRTEHMLATHTTTAFRLGIALMAAAAVGAFVLRPLMVVAYGHDYERAARILPALVLGGIPWSVTAIALGRARVRHDHVGTVAMTATLAVTILGVAIVAVPSAGLDGAVRAWLFGTTVSAVVAGFVSVRRRPADRMARIGGADD